MLVICKLCYVTNKVKTNPPSRCDEWYHTQCLGIDDLEVDLIDQFVCPLCIRGPSKKMTRALPTITYPPPNSQSQSTTQDNL